MVADAQRRKRIERMQRLRTRMVEWASANATEQLERGIKDWLGARPATKERVQEALLYAIMAPDGAGASIMERFAASSPKASRFERQMFEVWGEAWFSVFEVRAVKPGEGIELEDIVTAQGHWVHERTASENIEVGEWIATFVKRIDDHNELEGLLLPMVPGTRLPGTEACLRALREQSIEAGSAQTRRVASAVVCAIRDAEQTLRASQDSAPAYRAAEVRARLSDWLPK